MSYFESVKLEDGSGNPISSTSGSLNVEVSNPQIPPTAAAIGAAVAAAIPDPLPVSGTVTANISGSTVGVTGTVEVINYTDINGTHKLLVDGAGVTQPVSGTVAVSSVAGGVEVVNYTDINGTHKLLVDGSGVTQPVSGSVSVSNFPATQPVSGTVAISGTVPVSGAYQTTQPVSSTQLPAALDGSGNLKVAIEAGSVTATVSGSVTANQGTANTAANAWPIIPTVSGAAIDPRSIRALTSADVVSLPSATVTALTPPTPVTAAAIGSAVSAALTNPLPVSLPTATVTTLTPPTAASIGTAVAAPTAAAIASAIVGNPPTTPLPTAQVTTLTPPTAAAIGTAVSADLLTGTQLATASVPVALPTATITTLTPPTAAAIGTAVAAPTAAAIASAIVSNPPTVAVASASIPSLTAQGAPNTAANAWPVSLPAATVTTLTPPTAAAIGTAVAAPTAAAIGTSVAADLLTGTQLATASVPVALPTATITSLTPPTAAAIGAAVAAPTAAAIASAIVANPPTTPLPTAQITTLTPVTAAAIASAIVSNPPSMAVAQAPSVPPTAYATGASVAPVTDLVGASYVNLQQNSDLLGQLVCNPRTNQFAWSAALGADATLFTLTTTASATTGFSEARLLLNTGAAATQNANITSVPTIDMRSGSEWYATFSAYFVSSSVAGSHVRIGLFNGAPGTPQDGFFFGVEGTTVGLSQFQSGAGSFSANVSPSIPHSSFNGDPCNGAAGSAFTSNGVPVAWVLSYLNIYRLRGSWPMSAVFFEILSPDGVWVCLHADRLTNTHNSPMTYTTNLNWQAEVANSTNTSNMELSISDGAFGASTALTRVSTPITSATQATTGRAVVYGTNGTTNPALYSGTFGTAPASTTGALSVNAALAVGATMVSASAPLPNRPTDGTNAITAAISALGTAPTGTFVETVNAVVLPSTLAGTTLSSSFINATGAAVNLKATPGNLYGFSLTNGTAAVAFIEFFNAATTPVLGTTAVVFCIQLPASAVITLPPSTFALFNFSTGIGFAVTTIENGTVAAAVTGMVFYK